jgi:hypothetical protein
MVQPDATAARLRRSLHSLITGNSLGMRCAATHTSLSVKMQFLPGADAARDRIAMQRLYV